MQNEATKSAPDDADKRKIAALPESESAGSQETAPSSSLHNQLVMDCTRPFTGVESDHFIADLSYTDEDVEVSDVESFTLDQDDLEDVEPRLDTSRFLLSSDTMENNELRGVDPETQARLEALLEAAGIGKLSTADGKALADPEVLRKLTSSVSCALDEAAAALTRMRAEQQGKTAPDGRTLAEACSDGDINAVRKLLDEGRSVHETTEEGDSLLSLACSAGYYELAQVLLAMRANVEDRGIKGDCTPLMEAASGGYVDIVTLLIAHGADINAQSSAGNTPLHYAACGGFEDVVRVLINATGDVEEHNENGHTPLMEAASAGHVGVAKALLEAGAGINTHSNEFKESALTLACYKGHLEMVKFLLEAGADQEHKTDEMHTALMEASMDGHVEVARLLLDSGAQVNMPADSFESPLTLAACGGHVELANLLIERGAHLEEVNDEGYTPLMEASREGHEEMVALLLAHGADINARTDETQETALTLACCGGFLEVAEFLIKAGADIELGCSTPLMEAAQEGHIELVKHLLKSGANVHAQTGTGDTALTYACENGHTYVAEVLLEHGADLEHESEGGRTPLMKAARAGHLCTVQFLISKGADVNRQTSTNDHTVLSLACAGGHLPVVELLLSNGGNPSHKLKDGSTMLIEAAKGGHTTVVNLLLDYPNNVLNTTPTDLTAYTTPSDASITELPRVPMQGLNNVVPPQDPNAVTVTANYPPNIQQPNPAALPQPGQVNLKNLNIPVRTQEQFRLNVQKSLKRSQPGQPSSQSGQPNSQQPVNLLPQPMALPPAQQPLNMLQPPPLPIQSDQLPTVMTDLQPDDLEHGLALELDKTDLDENMKASERLEHFIDKMMKKAELLNTTREEQILKKQQILEELQKVERELKEKAQAQLLLSAAEKGNKTGGNTSVDGQPVDVGGVQVNGQLVDLGAVLVDSQSNDINNDDGMTPGGDSDRPLQAVDDDDEYLDEEEENDEEGDDEMSIEDEEDIRETTRTEGDGVEDDLDEDDDYDDDEILDEDDDDDDVDDDDDDLDEEDEDDDLDACLDDEDDDDLDDDDRIPMSEHIEAAVLDWRNLGLKMTDLPMFTTGQIDASTGLMVATPAVTLHETLGMAQQSLVTSSDSSNTEFTTQLLPGQSLVASLPVVPQTSGVSVIPPPASTMAVIPPSSTVTVLPQGVAVLPQTTTISLQQTTITTAPFNTQQINFTVPQTNFVNLAAVGNPGALSQGAFPFQAANLNLQQLNLVTSSSVSSSGVGVQQPLVTAAQFTTAVNMQQQAVQVAGQQQQSQQQQGSIVQLTQQQAVQVAQQQAVHVAQQNYLNMQQQLKTQQQAQEILQQQLQQLKLQQEQQQRAQQRPQVTSSSPTTTCLQPLCTTQQVVQKKKQKLKQKQLAVPQQQSPQLGDAVLQQQQLGVQTQQLGVQQQQLSVQQQQLGVQQQQQLGVQQQQQLGVQQQQQLGVQQQQQQQLGVQSQQLGVQQQQLGVQPQQLGVQTQQLGVQQQLQQQQQYHNFQQSIPTSAQLPAFTGTPIIDGVPMLTNQQMLNLPGTPVIELDAETESNHDTALTLACAGGHADLVQLLLSRGADIEHRDKKGFTPLILAATAGHTDVVEILLDQGADIEAQSERTKDTPLSLACSGGRYEVVELLLGKGACKEHRNVSDYTPLSLAASGGYVNIIKLLLTHNAEINSRTGSKLGISPLMLAAMNGHTAAVKLLLDMGSDINAQIETNRNTALTLACFQGRHEVVSLLVDRKANIEHRAKTGLTPLMEAASGGYVEVGRVLLDKNADVNAAPVPSSRDTALTIAADKGHYRFVELLLQRGAAVDVKNKKGNSPLWLACNGGHLDVVQLLVSWKADIDSQDNRKVSCLMSSFRKGHVKVVKWLVKHVMQFPSDQECMRYIATVTDKDLLKKCHQCMDIIVSAKDRQAAEANKNASILLEEIDMEKSREESKKAALARKREKRKKKRKEKQKEKEEKEKEQNSKNSSPEPEKEDKPEKDEDDEEDEEDDEPPPDAPLHLVLEPPAATVTATTGTTLVTESTRNIRNKKSQQSAIQVTAVTTSSVAAASPRIASSQQSVKEVVAVTTNNNNNKSRNKNRQRRGDKAERAAAAAREKQHPPAAEVSVSMTSCSDRVPTLTTVTTTRSAGGASGKTNTSTVHSTKSQKKGNNNNANAVCTSTTGIGDLDDFGTLPAKYKLLPKEEKLVKNASDRKLKVNSVDNFEGLAPLSSPGKPGSHKGKNSISSPSRAGQKTKEDGWKEVIRKSKKVAVPATAISRVIGRAGANINAIREVTGAHIEVDKQKGGGDRTITIKGSAESTRQAHTLITTLIKEPDRDLIEILPKKAKISQQQQQQQQQPVINVFTVPTTVQQNGGQTSPQVGQKSMKSASGGTGSSDSGQKLARRTSNPSSTQVWSIPTSTPAAAVASHNKRGKPVNTVIPSCGTKSPGVVSRQLFTADKLTTSSTMITTSAKTTITFTASSGVSSPHLVTTSAGIGMITSKPTGFATKIQPVMSSSVTRCDHTALPIKTPGQPIIHAAVHQRNTSSPAPGEYSPFNNLFSPVADQVLGKKDGDISENRMNFASVAAAGVVSTTSCLTPTPSLSPRDLDVDPILQAKAPGYKPCPQQRAASPMFHDANMAKAPGYKPHGLHHPGAPPMSNMSNLSQQSLANQLQTLQLSMAQLQLAAANMNMLEAQKAPGYHRGMSSGSAHGFLGEFSTHTGLGTTIVPTRDEYTTPDQPMTLPKIESTLNPNAPDFTSRMNMTNFQQNPAAFYKQNLLSFNNGSSPRQQQQQSGASGFPQHRSGFPQHFGSSSQNEFANSLSAAPGPRPSQFSPLPPGGGGRSSSNNNSSLGSSLEEPHAVNSHLTESVPSPSRSPTEIDDRRFPRPIGNERAHKKPVSNQFGSAMGDVPLWMFGPDVTSDWLTNTSSGISTDAGSSGVLSSLGSSADDRPHSAPGNPAVMSSFLNPTGLSEQALEQALQAPALMMANFANSNGGVGSIFPGTGTSSDANESSSLWEPQMWNSTSNWSEQPPAM